MNRIFTMMVLLPSWFVEVLDDTVRWWVRWIYLSLRIIRGARNQTNVMYMMQWRCMELSSHPFAKSDSRVRWLAKQQIIGTTIWIWNLARYDKRKYYRGFYYISSILLLSLSYLEMIQDTLMMVTQQYFRVFFIFTLLYPTLPFSSPLLPNQIYLLLTGN